MGEPRAYSNVPCLLRRVAARCLEPFDDTREQKVRRAAIDTYMRVVAVFFRSPRHGFSRENNTS